MGTLMVCTVCKEAIYYIKTGASIDAFVQMGNKGIFHYRDKHSTDDRFKLLVQTEKTLLPTMFTIKTGSEDQVTR